jgi:hypothetical protein
VIFDIYCKKIDKIIIIYIKYKVYILVRMNFEYVNFINKDDEIIKIGEKEESDYEEYDEETTETYRTLRLLKFDPMTNEEISKELLFEFKYKWDPITGKRKGVDEHGPLCFDALNLYQYYYLNRYNGLWYPPSQNFQGYYGDLLGIGSDMMVNGVRPYPEKYLYRLPIIDCYLKRGHNSSIITMGPKLTEEEIEEIDRLTSKHRNNKISLKKLKEYYDEALNSSPDISKMEYKNTNSMTEKELIEKYNKTFVDKLVNCK